MFYCKIIVYVLKYNKNLLIMYVVVFILLEKGNVNDFDLFFLGVLIKSLWIKKNIYIFLRIVVIVVEELF